MPARALETGPETATIALRSSGGEKGEKVAPAMKTGVLPARSARRRSVGENSANPRGFSGKIVAPAMKTGVPPAFSVRLSLSKTVRK
jgi:hypothetical protein